MTGRHKSGGALLIDGAWRPSLDAQGSFTATDPGTRRLLADHYPISGHRDVDAAIQAGVEAARQMRSVSSERIAEFLRVMADAIEGRARDLAAMAAKETGLPESPRLLDVELPRTTSQLRQAAAAAAEGSWRQAEIDTHHNLRTMLEPLDGPVVVFGPGNFPFAFNAVAGGDFAAAIAAGNPVIAKAHHGHPGTSRILAELALESLRQLGLPGGMVQMLYHLPDELGFELVADHRVAAVAFTGSRQAGLRLKSVADAAGTVIYLELSSINPVFVLGGALSERAEAIADALAGSCALGAGQFCTSPGLSVVTAGASAELFISRLAHCFRTTPAGTLLSVGGPSSIGAALGTLRGHGAELLVGGHAIEGGPFRFESTLLRVSGEEFLQHAKALQTEAFGTVHLVVVVDSLDQMSEVAVALEGNLTGCIYSHSGGDDDEDYRRLASELRPRVGRLLNDKMPTGVAVSSAMHHGGPFPSTGHPGFTSVGIPASLVRFAARRCYDAVRPHRLPPGLHDANPGGRAWRRIDGVWTRADVS